MRRVFPLIFILFSLSCHKEPPPPSIPQPIGTINSSEGETTITRGGTATGASANQPLYLKDTIETKQGKIKISLSDTSTIALSENSKIILNEFFIDEAAGFRKATINMATGQLRSVISKHFAAAGSETNIETPTIVAGIRGTELAITAESTASTVYCLDGAVEVFKPAERETRKIVQRDMFIRSEQTRPMEEPSPIPPELRRMLFEKDDYVPSDFRERINTFEAEYEAKKADMKAKEVEMKQKMKDKEKQVKEKMKANEEKFHQKYDEQKSKMDQKREDMLKKMKEKLPVKK